MMREMIEQIVSRIRLMIGRCVITATKYDGGDLAADAELLAGEKRRALEYLGLFGFSSRPKGNVSGVALFIGGSRDNGVIVASHGDDSEMAQELKPGEVCVHSPFGSKILLSESGDVVVHAASGKKVIYETDTFTLTGNLEVSGDVFSGCGTKKVSLSNHVHPSAAGPTSPPTPNGV